MESSEKTYMKTLASCITQLQSEGFKENFIVKDDKLQASEKSYSPGQVDILNFYRFEGESDPADNSILYAIETDDGTRGLLTDAYGAYADESISRFIVEVENITKKTDKSKKL